MEHSGEEGAGDKYCLPQPPRLPLRDVLALLVRRGVPSQLRVRVGREGEGERTFGLEVAMYSGDH